MTEEQEFEKYLMQECQKEIEKVTKDIEDTLKEKVEINNRQAYNPSDYLRTQQLVNNISSEINDREGIVYWKDLEYINNQGEDVSQYVPEWLNNGYKHEGWNGGVDYYHERKSEHFINDTVESINKKFGYEICKKVEW